MHILAAIAIVVATASIVVMDWVPTSLNLNIASSTARERLPGSLIHLTIGIVLATLCWLDLQPALIVAAIWYGAVLVQAIRNWWIPYFLGRHPAEITPELYEREYRRNLTILPAFQGHPVIPDVQHMIIHASIACAALLSCIAVFA